MSTNTTPMIKNRNAHTESKARNFYWLDDDPNRVSPELIYQVEHPDIDGIVPAKLSVINLKQVDVPVEVASMIQSRPKPDLVIIDHVLNGACSNSIMKEGSSIAVTVRGAWADVAIVGVSAIFTTKREKLSRVFEQEYIELFDFSDLTHDIPSLYAICAGFTRLCETFKQLESTSDRPLKMIIADLLDCPEQDKADLAAILPSDFKGNADHGTAHLLARWIWHHLTERPGLLYDARFMAVLLGLSKEGFAKVSSHFEGARFTGVFSSASRPRWWKSLVMTHLLEMVPQPKFASTIQRGRQLHDITEEDYSKSYFSDDPEPDTLASADEVSTELYPERIRYTEVHSAETLAVGFEPRRVYKEA